MAVSLHHQLKEGGVYMWIFGIFVTILMCITIPVLIILLLGVPIGIILYLYFTDTYRIYRNGYYDNINKEPPFWCKWFKKKEVSPNPRRYRKNK